MHTRRRPRPKDGRLVVEGREGFCFRGPLMRLAAANQRMWMKGECKDVAHIQAMKAEATTIVMDHHMGSQGGMNCSGIAKLCKDAN
jgi:hypothetical protein